MMGRQSKNPAPAEAESPQGVAGLATRQPAERPAGSSCKAPATPRPHRGLAAEDGKGGLKNLSSAH